MLELEPIERRVMQMLLAGEHPVLETLREQFDGTDVSDRENTGVGFFTSFTVCDDVPRLHPPRRIVIGDVCADIEGLEYGCGFILFIDDGVLGMLECHLWGDDAFPSDPKYNRLYYIHQPNPPHVAETGDRDIKSLTAKLAK
jgi:hypothetical protein